MTRAEAKAIMFACMQVVKACDREWEAATSERRNELTRIKNKEYRKWSKAYGEYTRAPDNNGQQELFK